MEVINGSLEDVIYTNAENGYLVGILETEDDVITIVGNIPNPQLGEHLELTGEWIDHPKFGKQFKLSTYRSTIPTSLQGIENYLSSGLIPGIGPKMAKRIVAYFGEMTLDILQKTPRRIIEVEGIGEKKADGIVAAFAEQMEIRNVMLFLQEYGISPHFAVKIYRTYEDETIAKIKENPYRLADDIKGIGFKKADEIAQKLGIGSDSEFRVYAGVKFVLLRKANEGYSYLPEEVLVRHTRELLGVNEEFAKTCIKNMAMAQQVKIEDLNGHTGVYLMGLYHAETGVASKLVELMIAEMEKLEIDVNDRLDGLENRHNIKYGSQQRKAIEEAVKQGVLVITGGPGTGKTTTINSIIDIFEGLSQKVLLAAPTGRAAKRMSEATGHEAKTIHRLLEYSFSEEEALMSFSKNEEEPLEADVIIIDEVSMVDITLMLYLLQAIKKGTRVLLVGDVDQLPSVGPGNVLRDIIGSKLVPVIVLDEIFRQAQESMIVVNAHKINKGDWPELNVKDKDFFFIKGKKPDDIAETILGLCAERLPKFNGYDPKKDIQVLAPMKKGECGVIALNKKLQERLNPLKDAVRELDLQKFSYRIGDKVMQIKNNYKMKWQQIENGVKTEEGEGVFNGDIGYIREINIEERTLVVEFEDHKFVNYEGLQASDELMLAYAVTIHKSQGSEFPVVVMPMTWGPPMLLTRNLLYTGITRARELVVLVGTENYMHQMIQNTQIEQRYSGLGDRLNKVRELYFERDDKGESN